MWRLLLWATCIAPAILFAIVPLAVLISRALTDSSNPTWSATNLPLLGRTILFSTCVALGATLLGTILGYRLGATSWLGKSVGRVLLLLPLLVPPYLHAVGWTTLLRAGGPVAETLHAVFSVESSGVADIMYSFGGAVFVLTLAYCPIAVLFAEKSLEWSAPSLVEAAQIFGAGHWRTFFVARWPQLRAAVASSALIVFLLTASELGVPTILKVRVFNFEVFTQLAAFNDIAGATLLCVPLVVIGLLAVAAERTLSGHPLEPGSPDIEPPRPANTFATRVNVLCVGLFLLVSLAAPIGAIVAGGLDGTALAAMARVAHDPATSTAQYAVATVVALLLISLGLSGAIRNGARLLNRLTDFILAIAFAVPGTIVALGLLTTYDQPGLSRLFSPFVLVVGAIVVRYAIVGLRVIQQARDQIPSDLLDAAAIAGAGPLARLVHVTLPLMRVALLVVALVGVVATSSEIGSTILLHAPGEETLPIALYAIEANSPRSYVAALSLIQLSLLTVNVLGLVMLSIFVAGSAFQRSPGSPSKSRPMNPAARL